MTFLSTILISVLITIILVPLLGRLALRYQLVDMPNTRSVHEQPIPRCGGIAIALGALLPIVSWNYANGFVKAFLAGAAVLLLMGVIDDYRELDWKPKIASQFAAAVIVVVFGGIKIQSLGMLLPENIIIPDLFAIPLTVIAIVGVTNAINLSDGLDGLAGGICLLSFCCIGFLAYLDGNTVVSLMSLAMCGAIFGFLRFNTHPATIFMGDTGSQLLGFSAVTMALALTQQSTPLSPLLPLIILGFPVLDTLTVMTSRIRQGRSPFSADKTHFHHQLMSLGLHHKEAVLVIYLLQIFLVLGAILLRFHSDWLLLTGYLAFSAFVLTGFWNAERVKWQLTRSELLEKTIRKNFSKIKERRLAIKVSFRVFEVGILLLLLLTCLLPSSVPGYVSWGALGMMVLLAAVWMLKKDWLGRVLRMSLYLMIPFAVYLSEARMTPLVDGTMLRVYHIGFALCALLIVPILNLSTRSARFRTTPKDLLILFIAVVIPNLPIPNIQQFHLGLMAAKIIMFYFGFEVMMAEKRGEFNLLAAITLVALGALAV